VNGGIDICLADMGVNADAPQILCWQRERCAAVSSARAGVC